MVKRCVYWCTCCFKSRRVREILEVELSEDEELKFDHSVQVLKETMAPVL